MKRKRQAAAAAVLAAMRVLTVSPVGMARFSDVPPGAPHADAVALLAELGITTGISEMEFGPDLPLTRQQFAVFVVRAQRQGEVAESLAARPTDFRDDAAIAGWARGHVALAAGAGIVNARRACPLRGEALRAAFFSPHVLVGPHPLRGRDYIAVNIP